MFRPSSIFFANRKVTGLRHHLAVADQPIAEADARQVVALAWGWQSWSELVSALEGPGEPSPLDEQLVGPEASAGAMALLNEDIVARRGRSAGRAIRNVIGLPPQMCWSLSTFLRLTGRHVAGTWLTPEGYRELYAACVAPRPKYFQDLLDDLRRLRETPRAFPLPPHRPR